MITVKRLKELLAQIPDNAKVSAYEGEDTGFNIWIDRHDEGSYWWIRAMDSQDEDTYIRGFD